MYLRAKEIEIPKENPFERDLLERKQYAEVLTQIVKNTESGFTLSINADWGYGKTTFIKMWEATLQNEGYKTIYFNAWESDFVADPMMALIDGLVNNLGNVSLSEDKKKIISALVDTAIGFVEIIPGIGGYGKIAEAIKKGVDTYQNNPSEIKKFRGIKKIVCDFKEKLSEFAQSIDDKKPLVIFIDELDRCRPDYAVKMLECVKHFFATDNIIFVLSVDKGVLCKSVKAFYGGLDIDTDAYLRRFVDIEFDLPEPNVSDFIEKQFIQKEFSKYFSGYWDYLSKTYENINREKTIKTAIWNCFLIKSKSLRDIEKYFNRLEIILNSKKLPHKSGEIIAYLLHLYLFHRAIYEHIRALDLDVPEFWGLLNKTLNDSNKDQSTALYREYLGLAIVCLAGYINDKEEKEQRSNPAYRAMRNGEELTWFPEKEREWLKQVLNTYDRAYIKELLPHIDLINATFDLNKEES